MEVNTKRTEMKRRYITMRKERGKGCKRSTKEKEGHNGWT